MLPLVGYNPHNLAASSSCAHPCCALILGTLDANLFTCDLGGIRLLPLVCQTEMIDVLENSQGETFVDF